MWVNVDERHLMAAIKAVKGGAKAALQRDLSIARSELARGKKYTKFAQKYLHRDGELEFDDGAAVSNSEDAGDEGAYVMGWTWVYKDDIKARSRRNV